MSQIMIMWHHNFNICIVLQEVFCGALKKSVKVTWNGLVKQGLGWYFFYFIVINRENHNREQGFG